MGEEAKKTAPNEKAADESGPEVVRDEHPAIRAARLAPKGPPLTPEERARIDAVRKSPERGIPHSEIMRELEEWRVREGRRNRSE